jgi:hypothetical protein
MLQFLLQTLLLLEQLLLVEKSPGDLVGQWMMVITDQIVKSTVVLLVFNIEWLLFPFALEGCWYLF